MAVALIGEIARQGLDTPVTVRRLAATIGTSIVYLEQISADLRRHGLLRSFMGHYGGYQLAKPTSDISMASLTQ